MGAFTAMLSPPQLEMPTLGQTLRYSRSISRPKVSHDRPFRHALCYHSPPRSCSPPTSQPRNLLHGDAKLRNREFGSRVAPRLWRALDESPS